MVEVFRFGALSENERPDLGTRLLRTSGHGQLVLGFFSHSMSQLLTNHILLQCLVKLLYAGDICMQHVPFRIPYCTFQDELEKDKFYDNVPHAFDTVVANVVPRFRAQYGV